MINVLTSAFVEGVPIAGTPAPFTACPKESLFTPAGPFSKPSAQGPVGQKPFNFVSVHLNTTGSQDAPPFIFLNSPPTLYHRLSKSGELEQSSIISNNKRSNEKFKSPVAQGAVP